MGVEKKPESTSKTSFGSGVGVPDDRGYGDRRSSSRFPRTRRRPGGERPEPVDGLGRGSSTEPRPHPHFD